MSRTIDPNSLVQRVLVTVENDGPGTVEDIALRVGGDRKRVYWALSNLTKDGLLKRVKQHVVYEPADD
ncbi:MAG: helix-turn-helix domain-containing protein [Candidatus Kapaibacterium sp.]|jgi:predicted transcriptional regulator